MDNDDRRFEDYEVGLDSQASRHFTGGTSMLLGKLYKGPRIRVKGATGKGYTDLYGQLAVWGEAAYLKGAPTLLSWAVLSEYYPVQWVQSEQIVIVEVHGVDYIFSRRNNVYVCDMRQYLDQDMDASGLVATVEANERLYTKAEVERAREARELSAGGGCIKSLAKMLRL